VSLADQSSTVVWRIPPAIAAALYLIAATLFATAIYPYWSVTVRIIVAALGCVFAAAATLTARQLLYADSDGVLIRRLFGQTIVEWPRVEEIRVVRKGKTSMTLAIYLFEGPAVLVPASLVLPATPHSLMATQALLNAKARRLSGLGGLKSG
jgi:hypothetical protein